MPRRKLFISHSTKGDEALALLMAAKAALESDEAGYEVLLDRTTLKVGDKWYEEVSSFMARADGAVFLWSRDAVGSKYVTHEASVITNRWLTEKGFRLFLAVIDAADLNETLRRTDLSGPELGPTRISQAHIWKPTDPTLAAHPDEWAAALAAELVSAFGRGEYGLRWRDNLVRLIEGTLSRAYKDSDLLGLRIALENAHTLTEVPNAPPYAARLTILRDKAEAVANRDLCHIVAEWIVEEAAPSLPAIERLWSELKHELGDSNPELPSLLKHINSAHSVWVTEGRPNCPIAAALSNETSAVVAINGELVDRYTFEQFWRSGPRPGRDVRMIKCQDRSVTEPAILEELAAAGFVEVNGPDDFRTIVNKPVICLLPERFPAGADSEAKLKALSARLNHTLFIAWPGRTGDALKGIETFPVIDPPIDAFIERQRFDAWRSFMS